MSTTNLAETKILKELSAVMPSVRDNLNKKSNPEISLSADGIPTEDPTALQNDMLIKRQRIPKLYQDSRFGNLKGHTNYLMQVEEISLWNFKNPCLLSILSPSNGMGKTHMAWCLLKKFFWNNFKHISEKGFYKEYEILNTVKSTYDENGYLNEEQVKKIFINKPLLVIDDLFRTKRNEWALSVMFEIIDSRIDWQLPTIITSNLTIQEIQSLDSSIASRINNSRLFQFEGDLKDWRTDK